MRTLEEIDKDLDKIKAEFDVLLAEKSRAEEQAAKYFRQDITLTFYTRDNPLSDEDISYIRECLYTGDGLGIVKIDRGYKFPITQEEYEKADN